MSRLTLVFCVFVFAFGYTRGLRARTIEDSQRLPALFGALGPREVERPHATRYAMRSARFEDALCVSRNEELTPEIRLNASLALYESMRGAFGRVMASGLSAEDRRELNRSALRLYELSWSAFACRSSALSEVAVSRARARVARAIEGVAKKNSGREMPMVPR